MKTTWYKHALLASAATLILTACGPEEDETSRLNNGISSTVLDLELPDSITGGNVATTLPKTEVQAQKAMSSMNHKGDDLPCAYLANESEDPFENGYEMTKFMVGAIATWSCVGDFLMTVSEYIPHDGTVYESDNDTNSNSYDPEDPTHFRVVDDSDTQTSIYLYYGYDRSSPPSAEAPAGFYLSWAEAENGDISGRMIVRTDNLDEEHQPDDPELMRMDFQHTDEQKVHDMFLGFGEGNIWADGLRIKVTKNLNANPAQSVFIAQGIMGMKAQFLAVDGIEETPELRFFTVSNEKGDGAAIAQMNDLSFMLPLNFTGNNLGAYLTDKEDIYYFDDNQAADQPWDWIHKSFTTAEYRGDRTTLETGGTWLPFDPSLDQIEEGLELGEGYFANSCAEVGDDCVALINAVFEDEGFADQEPNQGVDPGDWRSDALQGATYLDSVYPNGVDWTGAFEHEFQP